MGKGSKTNIPAGRLELYEMLVATLPEVQRKGDNVPYTSHGGHMFSYLNGEGTLALKLPKEDRERFQQQYGASLMEAYGIVQKEFVAVPETLLNCTDELAPYFACSFKYVKSLKPKPTKKPAKLTS